MTTHTEPRDTSAVGRNPHPRNFIGTAMRVLTTVTGSEFAEKYKIREPINRIAYQGTKTGFQTLGAANRAFKAAQGGGSGQGAEISMFDLAAAGSASSTNPMSPIDVKYTGSLSGLLDLISTRYGISWEYKAGVIRFKGDQTRSYTLYAFPTDVTQTNTISGQESAATARTVRPDAEAKAIHQRSDVCAVPAAGVVAEAMVALVLAQAVSEKFGGDTVDEVRRNVEAYRAYAADRLAFAREEDLA